MRKGAREGKRRRRRGKRQMELKERGLLGSVLRQSRAYDSFTVLWCACIPVLLNKSVCILEFVCMLDCVSWLNLY